MVYSDYLKLFRNIMYNGKGGIVVDELLLGRQYGGVAIFVNKTLNVSYLKLIVKIKECAVVCVNLINILFYFINLHDM